MNGPGQRKLVAQGIEVIDYLHKHPDSSREEIEAAVNITSYFGNVISFIRNKAGEEVIVTAWDQAKHAYVYRLALDAGDGRLYVSKRTVKVRNESANLVGVCNRIIKQYGPEPKVLLAKALLESVVNILDAADA